MKILAPLLKDFYKVGHPAQYPKDTTLVYSNFTPRGTRRVFPSDGVIAFGYQFFVAEYMIKYFKENFFDLPKDEVLRQYKRRVDNALGVGTDISHIGALHDLGYLPIHMKAVPEGTMVPYRVPTLTLRNTKPEFFWVTNMLETLLSNILWKASTSATTALQYRRVFEEYAKLTGSPLEFVPWQGHDFSFRGMSGIEDACLSGAGHLLSFTGTDTIPAIDFLEQYYGADSDKELIGGSVPATEHSVMCMGLKDGEFETFRHLIQDVYPKGIVSIVSDTWDLWRVLTEYLPRLKEAILAREGKVVIRPDSGDPVKILCGDSSSPDPSARKGVVRLLHETFGGTTTSTGHRIVDSHVGTIYGDSITPERQRLILATLKDNGFASANVVLGIGSFTYQYTTRDTDGWAMKATYGETLSGGPQAIWKDPATDKGGVKKSARGLLNIQDYGKKTGLMVNEDCSWREEAGGLLQTIFLDGKAANIQTLSEIRKRVESYL